MCIDLDLDPIDNQCERVRVCVDRWTWPLLLATDRGGGGGGGEGGKTP
eukprot:COSAG03_NODE_15409_length_431_cov_1.524096_1_plen_47_part_10